MNTLESRVADLEALVKQIREKTVRDVIDAVQITKERVFRAELGQLRKELASHTDVLSAHVSGEAERVFAKLSSSLDTQAVDLHGTHVKNVESLHEEHIQAVKSAAELLHDEQARILAQKCEELERNNAAFKEVVTAGHNELRAETQAKTNEISETAKASMRKFVESESKRLDDGVGAEITARIKSEAVLHDDIRSEIAKVRDEIMTGMKTGELYLEAKIDSMAKGLVEKIEEQKTQLVALLNAEIKAREKLEADHGSLDKYAQHMNEVLTVQLTDEIVARTKQEELLRAQLDQVQLYNDAKMESLQKTEEEQTTRTDQAIANIHTEVSKCADINSVQTLTHAIDTHVSKFDDTISDLRMELKETNDRIATDRLVIDTLKKDIVDADDRVTKELGQTAELRTLFAKHEEELKDLEQASYLNQRRVESVSDASHDMQQKITEHAQVLDKLSEIATSVHATTPVTFVPSIALTESEKTDLPDVAEVEERSTTPTNEEADSDEPARNPLEESKEEHVSETKEPEPKVDETFEECEAEYAKISTPEARHRCEEYATSLSMDKLAETTWNQVAYELDLALLPFSEPTVIDTMDFLVNHLGPDICVPSKVFNYIKNNTIYESLMSVHDYAVFISFLGRLWVHNITTTNVGHIVDVFEHKATGDLPSSPRAAVHVQIPAVLPPTPAPVAEVVVEHKWVVPPLPKPQP